MRVNSTHIYGRDLTGVDRLTNNDVLHIYDVFDKDYIDSIFFKKGTPKYIVSDHITRFDGVKIYGLPLIAEKIARQLVNEIPFKNSTMTTSTCFNFVINKKQINRFLCIKLVELFKLSDFNYTWSGVDDKFDMSNIIAELDMLDTQSPLDNAARSFILSPILLKKRFIDFSTSVTNNTSQISNVGTVWWQWENGIGDLFLNSAISLITESVAYQTAAVFTEKIVFAALGLTFPIWIGGYNQASEWKRLGFDIFDDIIDHSYQNYNTLIERCYYAFSRNIELLSNKEKATELRLNFKDRLLNNRELLIQNHLAKFVDQEISKFPEDLQLVMPEIVDPFRRLLTD
jgi:hypothetical protein